MSASVCTSCGKALSPNPRRTGTRCRGCNARALSADPAVLAKRSASVSRVMRDPAYRRRIGAAISAAWARRLQDPEKRAAAAEMGRRLQTPENRIKGDRARSQALMGWCPAGYRDEYFRLIRLGFRAAEARRIVKDQVRAERARKEAATPPPPAPAHDPAAIREATVRFGAACARLAEREGLR